MFDLNWEGTPAEPCTAVQRFHQMCRSFLMVVATGSISVQVASWIGKYLYQLLLDLLQPSLAFKISNFNSCRTPSSEEIFKSCNIGHLGVSRIGHCVIEGDRFWCRRNGISGSTIPPTIRSISSVAAAKDPATLSRSRITSTPTCRLHPGGADNSSVLSSTRRMHDNCGTMRVGEWPDRSRGGDDGSSVERVVRSAERSGSGPVRWAGPSDRAGRRGMLAARRKRDIPPIVAAEAANRQAAKSPLPASSDYASIRPDTPNASV